MARKDMRFGWIPDIPDQRDFMYSAPAEVLLTLPSQIDLRPGMPEVYDQGYVGSCTAQAIAAAIQYARRKAGQNPDFVPSRLFIYYNERGLEGTTNSDSGAMLRDGMKTCTRDGVCEETMWPYDGRVPADQGGPNSRVFQQPPEECYEVAKSFQVQNYSRLLQKLDQLKGSLAAGYPFVFGYAVYESFMSEEVERTGRVSMPSLGESLLGGHAVLAVGYDDSHDVFIVRNSWGAEWGDGGYCYMPYAYLLDRYLAADFWTIRVIEG